MTRCVNHVYVTNSGSLSTHFIWLLGKYPTSPILSGRTVCFYQNIMCTMYSVELSMRSSNSVHSPRWIYESSMNLWKLTTHSTVYCFVMSELLVLMYRVTHNNLRCMVTWQQAYRLFLNWLGSFLWVKKKQLLCCSFCLINHTLLCLMGCWVSCLW